MPGTVAGWLPPAGSSITEEMAGMTVSFCMSRPKFRSMKHSKNSHSTPTVMEKQKGHDGQIERR